jgi:hypothetical protein
MMRMLYESYARAEMDYRQGRLLAAAEGGRLRRKARRDRSRQRLADGQRAPLPRGREWPELRNRAA